MIKEIIWFIQRGRRGWADCDVWDFDYYLCNIIPQGLRKLKGGVGCPSEFYDKEAKNKECHLWDETLEEMAQGFEAAKFLKSCGYQKMIPSKEKPKYWKMEIDQEAMKNAKEKMDRGLQLFAKHFFTLWD